MSITTNAGQEAFLTAMDLISTPQEVLEKLKVSQREKSTQKLVRMFSISLSFLVTNPGTVLLCSIETYFCSYLECFQKII